MNPLRLIGLAAVGLLALRGGGGDGDDEVVDDGPDDLNEEPNSGEISGQNGTWRWTAFAASEQMGGRAPAPGTAAPTGWLWTVGKIDDSSLDIDGTAIDRDKARAAGILKATQMANKAPTGTTTKSRALA